MTGSPCRIGWARRLDPRARAHNCSPEHAMRVESYREARAAWEARREAHAMGYATEEAEYAQRWNDPAPTFRAWLVSSRGSWTERSAA